MQKRVFRDEGRNQPVTCGNLGPSPSLAGHRAEANRACGSTERGSTRRTRAVFTVMDRKVENRSRESAQADSGVNRSGIFNEVEDSTEVDGARASEQRP